MLDGTKAVAPLEGVVEVLGDLDKGFCHLKVLPLAYGTGATTLFGKMVRRYTSRKIRRQVPSTIAIKWA